LNLNIRVVGSTHNQPQPTTIHYPQLLVYILTLTVGRVDRRLLSRRHWHIAVDHLQSGFLFFRTFAYHTWEPEVFHAIPVHRFIVCEASLWTDAHGHVVRIGRRPAPGGGRVTRTVTCRGGRCAQWRRTRADRGARPRYGARGRRSGSVDSGCGAARPARHWQCAARAAGPRFGTRTDAVTVPGPDDASGPGPCPDSA
jgi:hypothetical protein